MSSINYITFNQDHSFLAVGTSDGFRIYSVDPFNLVFQTPLTENGASGDISILEMLLSTSLVAMILSPRLLRIINTKRQSTLCELTFHNRVGALRLNRKRLLVVLDDVIFFYDMQTMKLLHQETTPVNQWAICALSPNPENNYVAYPRSKQEYSSHVANASANTSHVPTPLQKNTAPLGGDVMLFDANEMQEVKVIPAHQSPLSCLAMNNDGTLLATASEKGTVIRVFEIPSAKKLFQFRRGSMPARIHYMSFNAANTLLCVASATETIHIFKLVEPGSGRASGSRADDGTGSGYGNEGGEPVSPGRDATSPGLGSRKIRGQSDDTMDASQPSDPKRVGSGSGSFMSMMRRTSQNVSTSLVSRAAGYLPSSVTEIWEPTRDFAWVKVPKSARTGQLVRSVVAMSSSAPQVMVATSEGDFLIYAIDLEKGGEGTLVRQYSVREKSESHTGLYSG